MLILYTTEIPPLSPTPTRQPKKNQQSPQDILKQILLKLWGKSLQEFNDLALFKSMLVGSQPQKCEITIFHIFMGHL